MIKQTVLKIFMCICLVLSAIVPLSIGAPTAMAEAQPFEVNAEELKTGFTSIATDYVKFKDRIAGSEGEREAADYIYSVMSIIQGIKPAAITDSDKTGVQTFSFSSIFDGKQYDSQNLIFTYKSSANSGKKVILGTNYDSMFFDTDAIKGGESFNGSAANVAFLVTFASYLERLAPNFDVDIVFFGAGESNGAGAKFYASGISAEEKKNILMMLNLDKFAIGKEIYFYVDEVDTELSNFAGQVSADVKQISVSHLGKVLLDEKSELGLNYTHIAQNKNNLNFMKSGVLTMNIFAGDYSSGLVLGRSEFSDKEPITYTKDDTIDYITKTFGADALTANMTKTFGFITKLFESKDFVTICESSAGQTAGFYQNVTNEKLVVYLTVCGFVLLVIVALLVYYKLSVKAYYANVEAEFTDSVLNISENISEDTQNIEIPKAVGQIIANDIKKDKKIKKKDKK